MTWLSIITTTLYYLLLPLTILFGWVVVVLAPILHLGRYLLSGTLLPLRLLAKFEVIELLQPWHCWLTRIQTLYIYLGIAAVVGLVAGSVLHLSSTILMSLFNLSPGPETKTPTRTAASVRAAREQNKLEEVWQSSSSKGGDSSLEKRYSEWLEKDVGRRRDDHGVIGQTILEEDDDSEF